MNTPLISYVRAITSVGTFDDCTKTKELMEEPGAVNATPVSGFINDTIKLIGLSWYGSTTNRLFPDGPADTLVQYWVLVT